MEKSGSDIMLQAFNKRTVFSVEEDAVKSLPADIETGLRRASIKTPIWT